MQQYYCDEPRVSEITDSVKVNITAKNLLVSLHFVSQAVANPITSINVTQIAPDIITMERLMIQFRRSTYQLEKAMVHMLSTYTTVSMSFVKLRCSSSKCQTQRRCLKLRRHQPSWDNNSKLHLSTFDLYFVPTVTINYRCLRTQATSKDGNPYRVR